MGMNYKPCALDVALAAQAAMNESPADFAKQWADLEALDPNIPAPIRRRHQAPRNDADAIEVNI
jgi:hypothetical protein